MPMRFSFPLSLTSFLSLLVFGTIVPGILPVYSQEEFRQREFAEEGDPELSDSNLKIEEVVDGLDTPTTMAFLGPNDFLVLEKDKGTCSESNQWQDARHTNTGRKRS